jgi:hypothetical protein
MATTKTMGRFDSASLPFPIPLHPLAAVARARANRL